MAATVLAGCCDGVSLHAEAEVIVPAAVLGAYADYPAELLLRGFPPDDVGAARAEMIGLVCEATPDDFIARWEWSLVPHAPWRLEAWMAAATEDAGDFPCGPIA